MVSLKEYTDILIRKFIEEQIQYLPNNKRVIDFKIISVADIFYKIMIEDMLSITDIPPIKISSIMASAEREMVEYRMIRKANGIDATLKETGHRLRIYTIYSKQQLEDSSSLDLLEWDDIASCNRI